MPDELSHTILTRSGSSGNIRVTPRISVDFLINGESLLQQLDSAGWGPTDRMGSLGADAAESLRTTQRLLLRDAPDSPSGRVLLYVCPECADIGCGAYSAIVRRERDVYIWTDFASENGYEEVRPIAGVGPFTFDAEHYERAIAAAIAA